MNLTARKKMDYQELDNWQEEEINPRYELETVEQLQAISEPIRYRMILMLRERAMTGAQLARSLDLSRPRAHYYLKSLAEVGLVKLKGAKISNGMIGKYYRAIANYFSYDSLAAQWREKQPGDPEALKIFKAISDFALTVLETSRDNIMQSEELARGYHSNFETALTEEQYESIMTDLRNIYERLMEIRRQNHTDENLPPTTTFRTTIFFTPMPRPAAPQEIIEELEEEEKA
jgi:DNA-binding transcriptional ArsR family regulator